ncbi:MAG: zinc-ribbon domain-containing protein [Blautia sp.]|nr:zinc-ribbon domain-containing protein [Lachnoclostridium sp.]MCM1212751.1 zinc-ribbon domain-containing protein [Blautia sp.]
MFCEQCGQELPANARFCSKCGNVVKNDAGEEKPAQKHISDRHLNPEWKDNIKEPGTKTQGRGGKILSTYLQKWKNLSSMAQKEKGVWIGSHAGALLLLCLLLAVIGLSGGKKAGKEWDGYLADMEAGKKIKEVRYEVYNGDRLDEYNSSSAQFDVDGRLTFYDASTTTPLIEKLEGAVPWTPDIRADGTKLYWDAVNYEMILFTWNDGCFYQHNGNGVICVKGKGESRTYNYTTVNDKKLVSASSYNGVTDQYSYDDDGKLVSWSHKGKQNEGTYTTYITTFTYDEAGNLVYVSRKSGSFQIFYYEYTYDEMGHPIRAAFYKHRSVLDVNWGLYIEDTYQYDDAGNLVSSVYRTGGEERHITYGENGNKTQEEEIRYDDEGKETGRTVWTYDAEENLTEEVEYDENKNMKRKVACAYDTEGNLIEEVEYDGNEKMKEKVVYTYDKKGNKTREERETYTVYGNKEYITSKVDSLYYDSGSLKSRVTTTYKYEANRDYSIVNLIDTSEEQETRPHPLGESTSESVGKWKVTYYTEEEIEAAQHAKEFKEL